MKILIITFHLLLFGMAKDVLAQPSDSMQISVVIEDFISGLRSRDSTAVKSLLAKDAQFQAVSIAKGYPELEFLGVDSLLLYAVEGKRINQNAVFQTDKLSVQIADASHATASMEYRTLLQGEIYRMGVIRYELLKANGKWKITLAAHSQIRNNHQWD